MPDKAGVVGRMPGDAGAFQSVRWRHPITPPSTCAALGIVKLELVGLLVKALTRDTT